MQNILWSRYIALAVLLVVGIVMGSKTVIAANDLTCIDDLEKATSPKGSAIISCLKQLSNSNPSNNVPAGTIVAWIGKGSVPSGWAICNGDQGTPDLRGHFLQGVGTLQETGIDPNGSDTHSHSASSEATKMGHPQGYTAGTSLGNDDSVWTTSAHNHPVGVSAGSNLPPNFRVVYIMKLEVAR